MNEKLNEMLLELLQHYKKSLTYQGVYRSELGQLSVPIPGPTLQKLVDEQSQLVAPLFAEAEQGLNRGEPPQYILESLLEAIRKHRF
jgi:hypothetical protein